MQTPYQQHSQLKSCALAALLGKAVDTVSKSGPEFVRYSRMLNDLSAASEGRFHLAVLGQFKRGKSTLLNALIGESILPVGVVPLTAAPTFIQLARDTKNQGEIPGQPPGRMNSWCLHRREKCLCWPAS